MEDMNRYLIVLIGNSKGVEKDLNEIADRDHGVDFVDSKVLFLGTFFSPYDTLTIHEKLAHRPAFLLFDITDTDNYGVNLPAKYYTGLFPEAKEILDSLENLEGNKPGRSNSAPNAKSKATSKSKKIEECDTVNDILDKLGRNDYNRECLTENELEILDSQK
jgi:hypothetical protein